MRRPDERWREILGESSAALDDEGWSFIVGISRLQGELDLGGDLGVTLRKLCDAYASGKLDLSAMKASLAGLLRASPLSLGYALRDGPPVLVRTLR